MRVAGRCCRTGLYSVVKYACFLQHRWYIIVINNAHAICTLGKLFKEDFCFTANTAHVAAMQNYSDQSGCLTCIFQEPRGHVINMSRISNIVHILTGGPQRLHDCTEENSICNLHLLHSDSH